MVTQEIRALFLNYFQKQDHIVVPSAPLIPHHDPTLLFVNAGMVPFKNVFTGLEKSSYSRAASAQKCLRAGGKHNDLENVGYTSRHHTFFEMLGNFSFGDYFKEQAIFYAWTFITKELGISPERLWVTVFAQDQEATSLWRKIAGLPSEKIIPIGTSDNFWSMGEVGPCGPCTEIFYDHGPQIQGGPPGSPEADGDRFVEIWNLVFMQFDQQTSEKRVPLPQPSIDTGMGLERLAAVMQGVCDNYDTDILKALVEGAAHILSVDPHPHNRASLKVLADHTRAGAFLIADGVLPSNEGRGYVLRRILRRAMRHGYLLGAREPLLARLLPLLIERMGAAYPELGRAQTLLTTTFDLEERRFQQTLEQGLALLSRELSLLPAGQPLAGDVAFKLYDTFGFPLDVTEDILREQGLSLDLKGFEEAMAQQRMTARAAWSGSGERALDSVYLELQEELGETRFLGYTQEDGRGQVQVLLQEGERVSSLKPGESALLIVNQTPFYGESGGQMGDTGFWETSGGACGIVQETQKKAGMILHKILLEKGVLEVGQEILLRVDVKRRQSLRLHHSATHLLHQALRQLLGTHVTQRGSLVAPEKLRFDFSHPHRLEPKTLRDIEGLVNAQIRSNWPVTTRLMTPEAATQEGALALFGEKYGEEVRVVTMGEGGCEDAPFSVELCGGTHVERTGDLGFFKILSESGIAAGIRRLEAAVGEAALEEVQSMSHTLGEAAEFLKTTPSQVAEKLKTLLLEKKALQQELQSARQAALQEGHETTPLPEGGHFLFCETRGLNPQEMKGVVDRLKSQLTEGVMAVGQVEGEKTTLVLGVLGGQFDAGVLLKELLSSYGARGGGRSDLAQGGWSGDPSLSSVISTLKERLGCAL